MMKVGLCFVAACMTIGVAFGAAAPVAEPTAAPIANLMEVYQEAQQSDPLYQQAVAQHQADVEALPQAWAAFLPSVGMDGTAGIQHEGVSSTTGETQTTKGFGLTLSATQQIFNFQDMAALSKANDSVKASEQTLLAAQQNLMDRVAIAYFNVLQAMDTLEYAASNAGALKVQMQNVAEKFKAGVATRADEEAAQAAFESAYAAYLSNWTALQTAREALTVITGHQYSGIDGFKTKKHQFEYALLLPQPDDVTAWVTKATQDNLLLRADEFLKEAADNAVHQAWGGHLPVLSASGSYGVTNNNVSHTGQNTATGVLDLSVPLFEGGAINSRVRQAEANADVAAQVLEQAKRQVVNDASTHFYDIKVGNDQLKADLAAVNASALTFDDFSYGYHQGTQTIVNVLTAASNHFAAKQHYAADLYSFINNQLALAQDAGVLAPDNLQAINNDLTQVEIFPHEPLARKDLKNHLIS